MLGPTLHTPTHCAVLLPWRPADEDMIRKNHSNGNVHIGTCVWKYGSIRQQESTKRFHLAPRFPSFFSQALPRSSLPICKMMSAKIFEIPFCMMGRMLSWDASCF